MKRVAVVLVVFFTAGIAWNSAEATDSPWICYVADRFPNAQKASEWKGARRATEAMNAIAPNAASNTIITYNHPMAIGMGSQVAAPMICVKQ